ncbi:SprT-like domain-containing protein [Ihubacter sp. mB4P-1]|uniref:SprT-like domain-containing protein n=1 Tax=Ihubacter sp. mB4P-1 TaxID=3242370 RepID=UPI003C7D0C64
MDSKKAYEIRLEKILRQCIIELREIGIYPSNDILSISENKRAKKRLGCCKLTEIGGEKGYQLEISSMLQGYGDRIIKDVVFHELLHTCPGCMNHGKKWKRLADSVNQAYGCSIKTHADYKELSLEQEIQPRYKYEIICKKCGKRFYRMRKGKVVVHPENYRCSKCKGDLIVHEL